MNFKVFPFFLVLSLLTNALWAQSEGGISVSGKVVGSGSEDPLPYATVVAYLEASRKPPFSGGNAAQWSLPSIIA
jgi:hypothetical protein